MAYIVAKSCDEGDELYMLRGMLQAARECGNLTLVDVLTKALEELEST
jgi:hypothetical protein